MYLNSSAVVCTEITKSVFNLFSTTSVKKTRPERRSEGMVGLVSSVVSSGN